mgnify:CR=1 FL=1
MQYLIYLVGEGENLTGATKLAVRSGDAVAEHKGVQRLSIILMFIIKISIILHIIATLLT